MKLDAAIEPGSAEKDNEDWVHVSQDLVLVLDGATARTDTGCAHGIAWFVAQLGEAIVDRARRLTLAASVAASIPHVAGLHPECDLTHSGTPSAAVGALRITDGGVVEHFVLGDVCVALDVSGHVQVIVDNRVSLTASAERAEADRHPIGSPAKQAALLRMKRQELAARNQPGGYWVAETNPAAVDHALTGQTRLDQLRRFAVLSDGAARAVAFGLHDWTSALALMQASGTTELIRQVRAAEQSDPEGTRWPRNKRSDDATAVFGLLSTP